MSQKILITGGCGFVGVNLALKIKAKYPEYEIICFDNLKRRGSELNISRLKDADIQFLHGDIRNKEDFEQIAAVDMIIEAAAEPSVLAGVGTTPDYVINSNLMGTLNCLNLAVTKKAKLIFLSTSRVYPIDKISQIKYEEQDTRFTITDNQEMPGVSAAGLNEDFSIDGARSFYGSSKLASELFIQEYAAFYGVEAIINRCGVLTGPWQMGKVDQGVVVLWLARHFWKGTLSYIGYGGKGKQVRDLLHIEDLYRLIDQQIHDFELFKDKTFNVGGGVDISVSLEELTIICEEVTGNSIEIQQVTENRPADIPVYITDNTRITALCGWKPEIRPKAIIEDIFSWMKENESALKNIFN